MLVEGQSEERFVRRTLAPHLEAHNVFVFPTILWTKRIDAGGGFRGGAVSWGKIRMNLLPLLRDTDAWVTTLLDFYGLPADAPGYQSSRGIVDPHGRVLAVQGEMKAAVHGSKFIPFLAMHEFEAWVFCAPDVVANHFGDPSLKTKVAAVVTAAGSPELVNSGSATHPKARLQALRQGYGETIDTPVLLHKIGLPAIRAACPHFAAWLAQLEALGQEA